MFSSLKAPQKPCTDLKIKLKASHHLDFQLTSVIFSAEKIPTKHCTKRMQTATYLQFTSIAAVLFVFGQKCKWRLFFFFFLNSIFIQEYAELLTNLRKIEKRPKIRHKAVMHPALHMSAHDRYAAIYVIFVCQGEKW